MADKNLAQIYADNPITVIGDTDLMYVDQGATTDAGISGADLKAQFNLGNIASGDLLANATGSPAPAVATTVTALLDTAMGSAQGDVLYRGVANWAALAPGTSGFFLQTRGPSFDPHWVTAVTSITTTNGITGGPITSTGTIGLAVIGSHELIANLTGSTASPTAATLTALIDAAIGSTQGDILYRDAAGWVALAPGTSGQFLKTQGAAANPIWDAAGGSSPWIAGAGANSAYGGNATDGGQTYTLAWGNRASALNSGSFVFAHGTGYTAVNDNQANQFVMNFNGGFVLGTGINQTGDLQFGASNVSGGGSSGNNILLGNSNTTHSSCTYNFVSGASNVVNANSSYNFCIGNSCVIGKTSASNYAGAVGNAAKSNYTGSWVWGDHNANPQQDTAQDQWVQTFAGGYFLYGGNLSVSTIGSGISIAEGSNAKQGIVTLSSGVGVVSNTSVTANSRIFYCGQDTSVTGWLSITARSAGSGFTITSSVLTDSGVVAYEIFEPS